MNAALAPDAADGLPEISGRLAVALVASLALHMGLLQSLSSVPAGHAGPSAPPRLSARLLPAPPPAPTVADTPVATGPVIAIPDKASAPQPAPAPVAAEPAVPAPQAAAEPQPASLLNLPSARYYRTNEVDGKPGLATAITPTYPERAVRDKLAGRVVLRFLINETGGLDDISVIESEQGEVFAEAAVAAFRHARFVPGRLAGTDVKTQMFMELAYIPGETPALRTEAQMPNGVSVQQIREGPLPWTYRHWKREKK